MEATEHWEITDDELRLCLVSGIGPRLRRRLLDGFGSAQAVLDAPAHQLALIPGVGPKLSRRIQSARAELDVAAERARCRAAGLEIVGQNDPRYPRWLQQIDDPPGVLFWRGQWQSSDELSVAVVGTRRATRYGLRQAERLAGALAAAGFTIISGLARGIDGAAHRAALAVGGRTAAVLGSGVLNVYPPEHRQLADQVACQGVVLSEFPPLREPHSGSFPQRNRVISGLSLGVLVIEAGERSGALISARLALEQGREVFAVPGRIDSLASRGCHRLLRDGARLVESVDDLLEELGPLAEGVQLPGGREVRHPTEVTLNEQERAVLDAVGVEPTQIDRVLHDSGLPISRALATLSVLEMRHLVRRLSGSVVARV